MRLLGKCKLDGGGFDMGYAAAAIVVAGLFIYSTARNAY
jgi:hypothetical protein